VVGPNQCECRRNECERTWSTSNEREHQFLPRHAASVLINNGHATVLKRQQKGRLDTAVAKFQQNPITRMYEKSRRAKWLDRVAAGRSRTIRDEL
jgi:hypothetical protein